MPQFKLVIRRIITGFLSISTIIFLSCQEYIKEQHFKKNNLIQQKEVLKSGIDKSCYTGVLNNKSIDLYVINNKKGLEATFLNYGQRLVSLMLPDKNGCFKDVVLGFSSLKDYQMSDERYFGATIGRFSNRIKNGTFSLNGKKYKLETNNANNHLHGGTKGFHNVVWDVIERSENHVKFSRMSNDGEEGYPGNLLITVSYELTEKNELKIKYRAETDKTTIINLTHHSFFNLNGEGSNTISNHLLMINADKYIPIDQDLIPNGRIETVAKTPFDFRELKPMGVDIQGNHIQLKYGKGYDHNFVLNRSSINEDGLALAAKVFEPESGRIMEVFTDEPGLQFYSGNFLSGNVIGKNNNRYNHRSAFCLETQHFPDSPNHSNFPSTILTSGEVYESSCTYKFSVLE